VTERTLTTLLAKHFEKHPRGDTECYEVKMVKTNSFNPKVVKDHQIEGLLKANSGMWYKISDSPIFSGMKTRFTYKKPFDAVFIKARRCYIVVIFYKPRRFKKAILIPIREFQKFEKSVKFEDLEKMGLESFYL